ncbi:hypothetical protein [Ralstonia sp.]|uniref:hypothetical protein n=1 Tax=Ralstonia sp. TaxID=54061 RepID=UPI00257DD653|nr:hypothetical protein [Ralstonia sp.]
MFNRTRVSITRGGLAGDVGISDVFDHEIPILIQAYGQGNVEPVEGVRLAAADIEDGIAGEHARLLRKYRRPGEGTSPAGIVYPSPADLARALGVEYVAQTGHAPGLVESVQYDGAAEADAEAAKPRRGRPPKVEAEA